MTLAAQLTAAMTRIGTEFKTVRSEIAAATGDLSTLTTTTKSSLVAAINELKTDLSGAGAVIDDSTSSDSTVYSSQKTNAQIAALIDDTTARTTTVYSSSETSSLVSTAVAALVNSAPGTLDTLGEIATALQADESTATALATSVGNKVDYSTVQTLTSGQMVQATSNIGAATVATVGDTTTDFASAFTAALT
jgi:hypothetical protein